MRAHDEEVGALRLTRQRPLSREKSSVRPVLADFAGGSKENASCSKARGREAEPLTTVLTSSSSREAAARMRTSYTRRGAIALGVAPCSSG